MPPNRSLGRNVHFYKLGDPENPFGGLVLTDGITNKNFYAMIEILLTCQSSFSILDKDHAVVQLNDLPLQPGSYYVTGESDLLYSAPNS